MPNVLISADIVGILISTVSSLAEKALKSSSGFILLRDIYFISSLQSVSA